MIQRIQTLFLSIAFAIGVILLFVPFSLKSDLSTGTNAVHTLYIDKTTTQIGSDILVNGNYTLLVINLLILSAVLYTILLFKNRRAQIRICIITLLIECIYLVMVFFLTNKIGDTGVGVKEKYLLGTYLIAAQAFLVLLAHRKIRKDELLIQSANRIR